MMVAEKYTVNLEGAAQRLCPMINWNKGMWRISLTISCERECASLSKKIGQGFNEVQGGAR